MLLNKDFLLKNNWAKKLYHGHAAHMPIIDYHCHLDPAEIYQNRKYNNLTQIWLYDNGFGDHYKWRLMRANGTPEKLITGNEVDPYSCFVEYVKAIEKAPGNPLFEWSHLELRRFFNIDLTINQKNANEIWKKANKLIVTEDFRAKRLIQRSNVRLICTTDDPVSDLRYQKLLHDEEKENGFKVLPTFRPENLMNIRQKGFPEYIKNLSDISGTLITNYKALCKAIAQRIEFFHKIGCRLADHSLNTFYFCPVDEEKMNRIIADALSGKQISCEQAEQYKSTIQLYLMELYKNNDWAMQLHINCFRDDSTKDFVTIGANAGFDSVGDQPDIVKQIKNLFDVADQKSILPKTIIYSLNSNDWLALASLAGSFQGAGVRQRIMFGNAWWFNDTLSGIRDQLTIFAQQGLLGNFIGMLTDSRSFLSYPRHEYFRRVLCELFGEWVDNGQLPEDEQYLGKIIEDICYNNAHDYFGFFAS